MLVISMADRAEAQGRRLNVRGGAFYRSSGQFDMWGVEWHDWQRLPTARDDVPGALESIVAPGVNTVGIRRHADYTDRDARAIKNAYRVLYRSRQTVAEGLRRLGDDLPPPVRELVDFIRESERGVCPGAAPRAGPGGLDRTG